MKGKKIIFGVMAGLGWLGLASLQAQTPPAVQQYQSIQRQQEQLDKLNGNQTGAVPDKAPELYPGENADVGPQMLLRAQPRRQWVEASFDSQYYYTSNTFLVKETSPGSNTDTGVLVSTAQVALVPTPYAIPGGELSPRLGFRYQWYNYGLDQTSNQDIPIGGLNSLDFDSATLFAEVAYRFQQFWNFNVGVDGTQLMSHEQTRTTSDYHVFYKELVPRLGIERTYAINDNVGLSLAYNFYYHITQTDPVPYGNMNDRYDNSLTLTYTQQIIPRLVAQPYYRYTFTDYSGPTVKRSDMLHTVGMTMAYYFNNWASVRTFVSYDTNNSHGNPTSSAFNYENINTGGGVNLTFKY